MIEFDGPTPPDRPLNLPGKVELRRDADEAIDALAAHLYMQALACTRSFGDFHLALSGGSTPLPLYRRLMYDPAYRDLPWKRTHLWIVDERCVPFDDPQSNFGMIRDLIVSHSDIPSQQVHPIPAMDAEPDRVYEQTLRDMLEWREKGHDRLDFVLLGMGTDGHTASLFPNSPALNASDCLMYLNTGPAVTPPDRVTMTFELINASRMIAVLVLGENKRQPLKSVMNGQDSVEDLPILGIQPLAGELHWYLDWNTCPTDID